VGGGTVFGPQPRGYEQKVSKQTKALARKSALNARARENAIFVIDRFTFEKPQTKQLTGLIARLGLEGQKVLVLTDGSKEAVFLSGRNLPNAHVLPYNDASTYHILWSDAVLIEASAIGHELAPVAEKAAAPAKKAAKSPKAPKAEAEAAPKAKKPAAKKTAAATEASEAPAKKPAAKKAAKKKED
jgi:hypothetical protein